MDEQRFVTTILENPVNRMILERLPSVGLPDLWLVSGCLFQTVWNVVTGRPPEYGIRDYDIFYFDDYDLSWEAEDSAIRRIQAEFAGDVRIELRNQARVHLWYGAKFGTPYPRLASATEGIDRFLSPACQIGVQCAGAGYRIYAPSGLNDLAGLIVRPNRTSNFHPDRYGEKAARWQALWPELTVIPAN